MAATVVGVAKSTRAAFGTHTALQLAASSSQRLAPSGSNCSVVEATRDGNKYVTVDLTGCRDARAIREHILSQFPIPSDLYSDFGIYLTEVGGITIGDALDDEQLLLYRQFAKKAPQRSRFIIQHIGSTSDVPLGEGSMTISSPWRIAPTTGSMTPNLPILEDSDSDSAETLTRFTQDIFSQLPSSRRASLLSRHRRTLSESYAQRLQPQRITITVTQDQENYLLVDITECTDAHSIRRGILSKLHIPEGEQSSFGIYYSKLDDFANCTALDDNQLFIRCRRLGDGKGSTKLLVRRINTANSRSPSNKHQPSPHILEPLRISIPLIHPKPSSQSPSTTGPSPRTESAPPVISREAPQLLKLDPLNSVQNVNRQVQPHIPPQTLYADLVRSRRSSMMSVPSRRSSGAFASPATLLALKFRSSYEASNPIAGASSSTSTRSTLNTPRIPPLLPLEGAATFGGAYTPFETPISKPIDEVEDRRVQVKNLLEKLIEQSPGSVEDSAHIEERAPMPGYQNKEHAIECLDETKSIETGKVSGSSHPSGYGALDDLSREDKGMEVVPSRNLVTINSEMKPQYHQLSGYEATKHPVATGGFGDIYLAKLPNGSRIGLKCIKLMIDPTEEGGRKIKHAAHELHLLYIVGSWSQVHGDLKGINILLSADFTPKIMDFGGAGLKKYTLQFATTTSRSGLSVRWTAPEIIEEKTGNTTKADIYSLGMTILEVITGKPPYACVGNDAAVIRRVMMSKHPARPEEHMPTTSTQGNTLWSLLITCWEYDPENRPEATAVRDMMRLITPEGLRHLR
ncbi:unnamed protein product [Rhizoctonia solani]|uniref:Protein kinase domain-containing protein n=1 Tax=Rhizoctonia solani TaxID=456999 RepID=A0A8H2XVQ1_9AGAM|nr:unnamed protein product [Rhizoctonia solani]